MITARQIVGLVLVAAGLAGYLLDVHVAWSTTSGAHKTNVIAAIVIVFFGIVCLFPSVADALVRYAQILGSAWPGGRRRTDPPPNDKTPPPTT